MKLRISGVGGRLLHITGKHTQLKVLDAASNTLITMGKAANQFEVPSQAKYLTTTGTNVKVRVISEQQLSNQMEMYDELLDYRKQHSVPPLQWSHRLTTTAQYHSDYMAASNLFEHSYQAGNLYGENIAAGYSTSSAAMTGFINSPKHNENLLNPGYRTVGIGYAASSNPFSYHYYWTQQFL